MATVDPNDLKPNSHAYKERNEKKEKPKLMPAIKKDEIVTTKKSLGEQFKETFIEEDIREVKKYVIKDVIVPGIKNTVLDMLSMTFFKEPYYGGRSHSRDDGGYQYSARYKYKSSSSRRQERDDRDDLYDRDRKVDYRNIVLRNRDQAEDVVRQLRRRIEDYDTASIADLFDLVDITGKYTDNNWGWDNPNDIGIRRVSSGYLIDVAEAKLID